MRVTVLMRSCFCYVKYVKIVHDDDNYQSIYAHLNSIHPSVLNNPNDITKGQVIGYMGNSGAYGERIDNAEGGQQIGLPCNENSPNIHLHFEVWDKEEYGVPNKLVDPSLLWGNERGWREEWRTNQVLGRCSLAIY